jgi:chromobox protein 4
MADSSKKDANKETLPEGNICTAEKIVKDRTYKGVKQYLIKWKSWAPRFNTWEPVENILDPWLLQEYNER